MNNNLSANSNDVIEVLLDRSKEQERTIAILQAKLTETLKENKDLQAKVAANQNNDTNAEKDPQ